MRIQAVVCRKLRPVRARFAATSKPTLAIDAVVAKNKPRDESGPALMRTSFQCTSTARFAGHSDSAFADPFLHGGLVELHFFVHQQKRSEAVEVVGVDLTREVGSLIANVGSFTDAGDVEVSIHIRGNPGENAFISAPRGVAIACIDVPALDRD